MAKSKAKRKPQGHPARLAQDPLLARVQRVMGQSVELVRELRDAGYDPGCEEMTHAMASATGLMTIAAMMEGVPTPYELRGWTRVENGPRGRTWEPPVEARALGALREQAA